MISSTIFFSVCADDLKLLGLRLISRGDMVNLMLIIYRGGECIHVLCAVLAHSRV